MIAFESAVRHLNFTRAAEELHTSQSAISRHVSDLETELGCLLFRRGNQGLALTEQGKRLYEAIAAGLGRIDSEMKFLAGFSEQKTLTITCSHEISHLYLMPRHTELQSIIGEDAKLKVLTQEYDLVRLLDSTLYDIALTYRKIEKVDPRTQLSVVLREKVMPLCSPTVFSRHKREFKREIDNWPDIPLLDLSKPNDGWVVWSHWLENFGANPEKFKFKHMTNYVYLLEAAAAGQGIVLGCEGLVERYIENGSLVPISDRPLETGNALCAVMTASGRENEAAKKCLEFLAL